MSRRRWLSQFDIEEYRELLILSSIQPVGCDRDYVYFSLILQTMAKFGGSNIDFDEFLMDTTLPEKLAKFVEAVKAEQGRRDGVNSDS